MGRVAANDSSRVTLRAEYLNHSNPSIFSQQFFAEVLQFDLESIGSISFQLDFHTLTSLCEGLNDSLVSSIKPFIC